MQVLEDLIAAAPTAMIHLSPDASAIQINSQWALSTGQASESGLEFGWMEMLDEESREDSRRGVDRRPRRHGAEGGRGGHEGCEVGEVGCCGHVRRRHGRRAQRE